MIVSDKARIKELETALRQLHDFLPKVMRPQIPQDFHRLVDPEGVLMFAHTNYAGSCDAVHVPELRSTLERLNLLK
jgi:hypothetical protein